MSYRKALRQNQSDKLFVRKTEAKEETKGADYGGTINASLVIPEEVFKNSILANASAIIGLYNHPSGNENHQRGYDYLRKLQKWDSYWE